MQSRIGEKPSYSNGHSCIWSIAAISRIVGRKVQARSTMLRCGFDAARCRMAQERVWSDARENTADGVKRIFLRDSNGVLVELNFRMPQQIYASLRVEMPTDVLLILQTGRNRIGQKWTLPEAKLRRAAIKFLGF
jgi:hypothetical protein